MQPTGMKKNGKSYANLEQLAVGGDFRGRKITVDSLKNIVRPSPEDTGWIFGRPKTEGNKEKERPVEVDSGKTSPIITTKKEEEIDINFEDVFNY
jgi:hypothetical protein